LNKERSRGCRLHADQVPGGVVTKHDECSRMCPCCIGTPLGVIFGYDVRDIWEHLLEEIESISMARSSGTRL
jgi:hypothetical protein